MLGVEVGVTFALLLLVHPRVSGFMCLHVSMRWCWLISSWIGIDPSCPVLKLPPCLSSVGWVMVLKSPANQTESFSGIWLSILGNVSCRNVSFPWVVLMGT